jgi:nitroimidazol reductase NimA-like FMN-containing flavoprotein (pyridoxamine 5'-phosphate oxidase superfamily)
MALLLDDKEIDQLLFSECTGRIGYIHNGEMFIAPVYFGFDGQDIYAHSAEGAKIEGMRDNPEVCFEVDHRDEDGSWKGAFLRGKFEEIDGHKSRLSAMRIFAWQMSRLIPDAQSMPSHGYVYGMRSMEDPFKSVVFRIKITSRSGRTEDRLNKTDGRLHRINS